MGQLIALSAFLLLALGGPAARAEPVYAFDQRHGSVSFAVDVLGLLTAHGNFGRFAGTLRFDLAHPEATQVDVDIAAGSVEMVPQQGRALLLSAPFFDVAEHPDIRFHSTAVVLLSGNHLGLTGALEVRGVSRAETLDVVLTGRHVDAQGNDIADVVATGNLPRSAFGMVTSQGFIADMVRLRIVMRVVLGPAPQRG